MLTSCIRISRNKRHHNCACTDFTSCVFLELSWRLVVWISSKKNAVLEKAGELLGCQWLEIRVLFFSIKNNLKCRYRQPQVLWSKEKSILSTFWQHLPLATSKSLDMAISVWTMTTTTQLITSPLVHVHGVIVTSVLDGLRSKDSSICDSLQTNPNFQDFWEFDACSDSRYQVLLSSYEQEIQCSTQVWNPTPQPRLSQ